MKGYRLPPKLLLGAASSALQAEGGKVRDNWSAWNRIEDGSSAERAADHWERWKEDIDIGAAMGLETFSLSLSWARLQPQPGMIDYSAVNHYRSELSYLKTRGIRPVLVLHQFSDPAWFAERGGFTLPKNVRYFLKFVGIAVNCFGDLVSDYVTFAEPNTYAFGGYGGYGFPPGESKLLTVRRVLSVMAGCHIRAYEKIHRMRRAMGYDDTKVGMTLRMYVFSPLHENRAGMRLEARLSAGFFQTAAASAFLTGDFRGPLENLGHFSKGTYCDYLGIAYAQRVHVAKAGDRLARPQDPKDDSGRELFPQGLETCMQELYGICRKPIRVYGGDIDDHEDAFRSLFLCEELSVLAGTDLPVEAYYYRSFTDGFEYLRGEKKSTGLIRVDYASQERRVRKSGRLYREIIACRGVTPDLLERYVKGEKYHK